MKGDRLLLEPIIPFEPVSTDVIPQGEQWIAQIKWDGVRILTYWDGQQVSLYNRKRNPRSVQFPELLDIKRYCKASSIILDGEVIAFDNGRPSFHEVMKRDGIRKEANVERAKEQTPIAYMIFDVLFCNGEWVTHLPLQSRMELLSEWIVPQEDVLIVESFHDPEVLYQVTVQHELEGIVCKDLTSIYSVNEKNRRWQKKKIFRDLNAVVGGFTLSNGLINALLFGVYDELGQLQYIGHAGRGKMKQAEWEALSEMLKQLIQPKKAFVNQPERYKEAVWVKPLLTAKLQFLEWTKGRTLRQPVIQAFVNVSPEECKSPPIKL
ncbi:DNA ligase [Brevibacillus ginsengisoli]|uniref:ATP-dependent DNA ligase n=1 Tax=Brevibacillus ginsengisoli TaxID=363854 RepID=UPI003CF3E5C4